MIKCRTTSNNNAMHLTWSIQVVWEWMQGVKWNESSDKRLPCYKWVYVIGGWGGGRGRWMTSIELSDGPTPYTNNLKISCWRTFNVLPDRQAWGLNRLAWSISATYQTFMGQPSQGPGSFGLIQKGWPTWTDQSKSPSSSGLYWKTGIRAYNCNLKVTMQCSSVAYWSPHHYQVTTSLDSPAN